MSSSQEFSVDGGIRYQTVEVRLLNLMWGCCQKGDPMHKFICSAIMLNGRTGLRAK